MKTQRWTKTTIFLFLTMLLIGCSQGASYETADSAADYDFAAEEEAVEYAAANRLSDDAGFETTGGESAPQVEIPQERLIIRNGNIHIYVDDSEQALDTIEGFAEGAGGWVVNSNIRVSDSELGTKYGNINVRVPSADYDAVMQQIRDIAAEVRSENSSGQDVTDEYVDISSRLRSLQATYDRTATFLEEADNVEEALAVNVELNRLQEQIELLQGRREYLSQSAAFSSIDVTISPSAENQPIQIGRWTPGATVRDAIETLVSMLQSFADVAIWLLIVGLPFLLIVAAAWWLLRRVTGRFKLPSIRRRSRREASTNAPANDES